MASDDISPAATAPTTTDGSGTEPTSAAPPSDVEVALGWFSSDDVEPGAAPVSLSTTGPTVVGGAPLLTAPARRRRHGWVWPVLAIVALCLAYVVSSAVWPLTNVQPVVTTEPVGIDTGRPFGLTWPEAGGAAVTADGAPAILASSDEAIPMASVTKVVSALMIIERTGLELGDDGQSFSFSQADSDEYWEYLTGDESSLDVPVDGTLSLHQMLEGIMLGSANNYVDRLVAELWGSEAAFLDEVAPWLAANGLSNIEISRASGMDQANVATPEALIELAEVAHQNDVLAEIMAEKSVDLPGAGHVDNSNPLINDAGVTGLKTGSLWNENGEWWNLLASRDVTIGGEDLTLYAAILGQPDAETRESVSRALLEDLQAGMSPTTVVASESLAARVTTLWGAQSDVVVADDLALINWEGVAAESTLTVDETGLILSKAGDEVGELSVRGAFDDDAAALVLTTDLPAPDLWWRLTHPLDLWGLAPH